MELACFKERIYPLFCIEGLEVHGSFPYVGGKLAIAGKARWTEINIE